uniref:Perilipin n=1 Tax=Lepisosteus oculatus TaxID=7918 RepID=W5NAN4_LEPOC
MKTIRKEKGKRETVQESVLARLLALPVVDGTFAVIERAYSSTKHVHPVVCSVCEVYETGAKVATSLAVLSIQPAIHRLEPQRQCLSSLFLLPYETIVELIQALLMTPGEICPTQHDHHHQKKRSGQNKMSGTCPVKGSSFATYRRLKSLYRCMKSIFTGPAQKLLKNKKLIFSDLENLKNIRSIIESLAKCFQENRLAKPENDKNTDEKQLSCVGGKIFSPKGSYRRLEALASTVWRRAYDQTATQLQRTKSQGQELVMWVPGVAPLTSLAKKNLEFAGGVLLAVPSSVSGLLFGGTEEQKDKEKKKKKEGELLQSDEVQGLVSSLGHQLQNAFTSVVSSVRSAPEVTVALAKDTAGALIETWSSVLKNVSH